MHKQDGCTYISMDEGPDKKMKGWWVDAQVNGWECKEGETLPPPTLGFQLRL